MRKWKNERGRSKGREYNYLDQSYFHVFFWSKFIIHDCNRKIIPLLKFFLIDGFFYENIERIFYVFTKEVWNCLWEDKNENKSGIQNLSHRIK